MVPLTNHISMINIVVGALPICCNMCIIRKKGLLFTICVTIMSMILIKIVHTKDIIVILHFVEHNIIFIAQSKMVLYEVKPSAMSFFRVQ